MTQPPPTSPLFPYTTLFRSNVEQDQPKYERVTASHSRGMHDGPARSEHSPERGRRTSARPGQGGKPKSRRRKPDRKSTRLNSSHPSISYAVFCLKKKSTPR